MKIYFHSCQLTDLAGLEKFDFNGQSIRAMMEVRQGKPALNNFKAHV